MMISGVMLFDHPLEFERLREMMRARLLPLQRFGERVVRDARGRPRWEAYPALDLDEHLLRERWPDPGDQAALQTWVGRKMSEPLDFARPLWQFHYVENLAGGSALIARFHHCMGDGLGLMMALLAMTDLTPDVSPSGRGGVNPFLDLLHGSAGGIEQVRRELERIMPEGSRLLLRPGEALRALSPLKRWAASAVALTRLVLRTADSKTRLNATLGVAKRAAWSRTIPVDQVKQVGAGIGGTVNDILLTAMAGGVRRYLVERDGESGCRDFRAMIPVSLRPIERLAAMGNEFGLVYLSLPIAIADPVLRLSELRRRMESLKRSAEALVSLRVIGLTGHLPAVVQRLLVGMLASKATAVMTNLPGPNQQLYMVGKPITDMIVWVPRSARLSLGVSIMSYAGNVRMGVATDAGLVPDPERIVDGFHAEFDIMLELARSSVDGRP
jgi:WS/DGAT/MGAT family acyltransferase